MKLVWSEPALGQLDEISAYIARDNPAAATKVAARIRATAALLATTPRIGRVTDRPGVFALTVVRYPYIIFYGFAYAQTRFGSSACVTPGDAADRVQSRHSIAWAMAKMRPSPMRWAVNPFGKSRRIAGSQALSPPA